MTVDTRTVGQPELLSQTPQEVQCEANPFAVGRCAADVTPAQWSGRCVSPRAHIVGEEDDHGEDRRKGSAGWEARQGAAGRYSSSNLRVIYQQVEIATGPTPTSG